MFRNASKKIVLKQDTGKGKEETECKALNPERLHS